MAKCYKLATKQIAGAILRLLLLVSFLKKKKSTPKKAFFLKGMINELKMRERKK